MAWGHSEDVALDSGGNFSRFFSLSPRYFVRKFFSFFVELLLLVSPFPKRCGKVAISMCSSSFSSCTSWDAKFKWFTPGSATGIFTHFSGECCGLPLSHFGTQAKLAHLRCASMLGFLVLHFTFETMFHSENFQKHVEITLEGSIS